jgi:hypothetical protein
MSATVGCVYLADIPCVDRAAADLGAAALERIRSGVGLPRHGTTAQADLAEVHSCPHYSDTLPD